MTQFEAWGDGVGIQEHQKSIEQCVVQFQYPRSHLVCCVSTSIGQKDSGDIFTTDISEWLHICNVKEEDRSSNKVNHN